MTDNGFLVIRHWMIKRFGLVGTPLVLYAEIYHKFEKFGEKTSEYSLRDYGCGNSQIIAKGIKFLKENGFIEETEEVTSKGFKNKVLSPVMKKLDEYDVPERARTYEKGDRK